MTGTSEAFQIGSPVSIMVGDDEVMIIGDLVLIDEDYAVLNEAHAFHRIWGGSNGGRGKVHRVKVNELSPCPQAYRHIVEQVKSKREGGNDGEGK